MFSKALLDTKATDSGTRLQSLILFKFRLWKTHICPSTNCARGWGGGTGGGGLVHPSPSPFYPFSLPLLLTSFLPPLFSSPSHFLPSHPSPVSPISSVSLPLSPTPRPCFPGSFKCVTVLHGFPFIRPWWNPACYIRGRNWPRSSECLMPISWETAGHDYSVSVSAINPIVSVSAINPSGSLKLLLGACPLVEGSS